VKIPGVQIHNPDIGGLLPVYVKDPYEGFEVKTFSELTEEELAFYIEANVAAVREVAEGVGGIDLALANHEVMGPAILARAAVAPYAVKVHGSALEYTVKPHLERFGPYAYEGMEAAGGILVGSLHTGESLWNALPDLPSLKDKTRLGPPGVDVEEFAPLEAERERLVVFVGKLIVSKGVDLLLAAWPLVHAKHPGVRL
jgi:glycosyltransferase involved in cell wall biosynthesis